MKYSKKSGRQLRYWSGVSQTQSFC